MTRPTAHLNASLPVDHRAKLLLAEMTVEEKARQLTTLMPTLLLTDWRFDAEKASYMLGGGLGGISPYASEDPSRYPVVLNAIQRYAVEETRLGIPLICHVEALAGVAVARHPVFPTAIGLASTWSPDLVEAMTDAVRKQMLRLGIRQALSPVLDIALDPRWGRVHETYGEDPMLAAALGVAFVRGLQGTDLAQGVIATSKHFLGYALGQGGLNTAAYEGGSRFTCDVLTYPVEAAIREAGLRSVMNSYGDVNGIPAVLSRAVLTDLLRDELGFDGFVISDYMTLQQTIDRQRVARDPGEAARLALHAGLDMEAPFPFGFGDVLAAEVTAGRASMEDLDIATLRVLTAKFELGLFEQPYAPEGPIDIAPATADGADVATTLAERAVILLENDGILPLAPGRRVAVIGPHATQASLQIANYTYPSGREMYRFMESGGLGNLVGMDAFRAEPESEETANLDNEQYIRHRYGIRSLAEELEAEGFDVISAVGSGIRQPLEEQAIEQAVAAAQDADLVVLALGGYSAGFTSDLSEGEGTDTADIGLPAVQRELADAVIATGKPVVAVLVQGRPYVLPDNLLASAALVVAPFGGQAGTKAIADVLTGVVNPSGKLPYTIPRHGGQYPVFHYQQAGSGYRRETMGHGTHYLDLTAAPQYPFGVGGSYTSFSLEGFTATSEIDTAGVAELSVTVRNTGDRAGAEVVQVYGRVNASLVTRPAQQLLAFARVELEPGASARVVFRVPADLFAFTGVDDRVAVEPNRVDLFVGGSSDDRQAEAAVQVVGERRLVGDGRRFLADVTVSSVQPS